LGIKNFEKLPKVYPRKMKLPRVKKKEFNNLNNFPKEPSNLSPFKPWLKIRPNGNNKNFPFPKAFLFGNWGNLGLPC